MRIDNWFGIGKNFSNYFRETTPHINTNLIYRSILPLFSPYWRDSQIGLCKVSHSIRLRRRYAIATIEPLIQVFGYHSTSKEKASTILSKRFWVSDNDYNWLGEGVYFLQDAPYRAIQWATQQHPQHPAVIQLDNYIDLLDINCST